MKQIRNNVFETNSSSTHSICIIYGDTKELIDLPSLDGDGNLNINTGEYGWGIETFHSVYDRLSYAATFIVNYNRNSEEIDNFIETVKRFTGAVTVTINDQEEIKKDFEWSDFGYIDHQSIEDAAEIFSSQESLEYFLFHPNSYFKTDNDNH